MIDLIVYIWLLVFVILFIANLYTDNPVFGLIAGMWFLILGLGIIVDGFQMQTGMTLTEAGNTTTVTNTYTDVTLPFSTYSIVWGIIILCISIYIIYRNAEDLSG